MGALSAIGFVERAPTRLALLGTLPRKREREGHTAGLIGASRISYSLVAPAFENRLRMRNNKVSQTSR